jgi:hypothetical protein
MVCSATRNAYPPDADPPEAKPHRKHLHRKLDVKITRCSGHRRVGVQPRDHILWQVLRTAGQSARGGRFEENNFC